MTMKRINGLAIAAALAAVMAAPASAATLLSTVDIFLASQPNGTSVSGYFGSDTAPANAPLKFTTTGGATLTFAASGSTSVDATCFAGPDGGCYSDISFFSPAPASGTFKGPGTALVGVFLDASVFDVSTGPASLDYTIAANRSLLTYAPTLGQIFFIGDGLTDTNAVQQFTAPGGATRLFLAVSDSIGASFDNSGSLSVDVTGATLAGTVPEPASWALLVAGFGAVGTAARRRRTTVVAA